jgi:hypothetical protein
MDRGYDSEKMHRFIRETLNADSIISARIHQGTKNVILVLLILQHYKDTT